jgi:hypothetical protein
LNPTPSQNDNNFYGVEISEDSMPLFSGIGDTCPPQCACDGIDELFEHIDNFIRADGTKNDNDNYTIHTGKNDASVEDVCLYGMRDSLQWWTLWHGSLERHHWKHMYLAFSVMGDDIGILHGERTESTAGKHRDQLNQELRWVYKRSLELFDTQPNAPLLRRYATNGFIIVPLVDRYRERTNHIRISMPEVLTRRIAAYRTLTATPIPQDISGTHFTRFWRLFLAFMTTSYTWLSDGPL